VDVVENRDPRLQINHAPRPLDLREGAFEIILLGSDLGFVDCNTLVKNQVGFQQFEIASCRLPKHFVYLADFIAIRQSCAHGIAGAIDPQLKHLVEQGQLQTVEYGANSESLLVEAQGAFPMVLFFD
jgi:hypothetical protein